MAREHGRLSWVWFFVAILVFLAGLFLLAWALNRQGNFGGGPMGVVGDWFREAVNGTSTNWSAVPAGYKSCSTKCRTGCACPL